MLIVRQSAASNYCAPYSTLMLLQLWGHRALRTEIMRAFGAPRRGYPGARHRDVSRVIAAATGRRARWLRRASFDLDWMIDVLGQVALPTLISIVGRHRGWRVDARHMAVAVDVGARSVRLLDPLGRRIGRRGVNASIVGRAGEIVTVRGACYDVVRAGPVAILHHEPWRPT